MERLFPVPEVETGRPLSDTQRRTLRQRADIERGVHPVARAPLAGNGETCGSCVNAVRVSGGNRGYWKCALIPHTFGPGTDIRKWWPACTSWSPSKEEA